MVLFFFSNKDQYYSGKKDEIKPHTYIYIYIYMYFVNNYYDIKPITLGFNGIFIF